MKGVNDGAACARNTRADTPIPKPARSQIRRVKRSLRARCAIQLIVHAHHENRLHPAVFNWKCDGQEECPVPEPGPEGVPLRGGLAAAPNGAGIPENLEPAIAVVHRIVDHAIAAYRVDVETVPTPHA